MVKGKRKVKKAKKIEKKYKCKYICDKRFASYQSRAKHHRKSHSDMHSVMRYTRTITGTECEICLRRCSCKYTLGRHVEQTHHINGTYNRVMVGAVSTE